MDPFDQRVPANSTLVLNRSNRHSGGMQRLDMVEQGHSWPDVKTFQFRAVLAELRLAPWHLHPCGGKARPSFGRSPVRLGEVPALKVHLATTGRAGVLPKTDRLHTRADKTRSGIGYLYA